MSLAENAIIDDTEEVWAYLSATEEERVEFEPTMEAWINGTSSLLERLCNRNIVARTYENATQDGNGRRAIYLDHSPILSIDAMTINDSAGITLNVLNVATDIFVNRSTGKVTLHPSNGFTSVFIRGAENITTTYRAGFEGTDLEVFRDAIKELILIRWKELGENPLNLVRSDNIGTSVSNTKFDPRRLSHIVQHTLYMYRRVEV